MEQPWTDEQKVKISADYRTYGAAKCPTDGTTLSEESAAHRDTPESVLLTCKQCGQSVPSNYSGRRPEQ